jgi:hypothetical protein
LHENQNSHKHSRGHGEGLISAISVGAVFIIIGIVFTITPDLPAKIGTFFRDITSVSYPFPAGSSSTITLPGPLNPASHGVVYTALMQFDLAIGILQILILALRLGMHSPTGKTAETAGNLIFWLGAAVLVNSVLAVGTIDSWFQFWGALIVVIGVSLVARAIVHFAKR